MELINTWAGQIVPGAMRYESHAPRNAKVKRLIRKKLTRSGIFAYMGTRWLRGSDIAKHFGRESLSPLFAKYLQMGLFERRGKYRGYEYRVNQREWLLPATS